MAQKGVLMTMFAAALSLMIDSAEAKSGHDAAKKTAHKSNTVHHQAVDPIKVRPGRDCGVAFGHKAVCGKASYYGAQFNGGTTASGETFSPKGLTAAVPQKMDHLLGKYAQVINPDNGATVMVKITDTGAFKHPLDLTPRAFKALLDKDQTARDVGKLDVKVVFVEDPDQLHAHKAPPVPGHKPEQHATPPLPVRKPH